VAPGSNPNVPAQPTWQKLLLGDKSRPKAKYLLLARAAILAVASVIVLVAALAQGAWQWVIGVIGLVVAAATTAWAFYWWV
jgi:hypothetical protein